MNPIPHEKLHTLEPALSAAIKGQDHVVGPVCSVLERAMLGLQPTDKPLGSFLFLGPTGVGKTQLTIEFTRHLFGENALFRFDMSEFQHVDSVKLLLGDESGRTGRLGKVLSEHTRGVLLFDELEKAHRLIWDLFLQMLDAARITLSNHRTYDLSGFFIVCTSNIGSQLMLRTSRLPFATQERAVLSELHRTFRPELIGRFSEKLVFKPLSWESQREIGRMVIAEELERLNQQGLKVGLSEPALEFIVRRSVQKQFGARALRTTAQRFLGDAMRHALKTGNARSGVIGLSDSGAQLELRKEMLGARLI